MQEVVLSQRPQPEGAYALPAASSMVLGEYVSVEPVLISERARQSTQYAQAVGRHGLLRQFQQKDGRMSIFFDDGGVGHNGQTGWWIAEEDSFGETCLLWCPGARGRLPETGWQWRGYMSWYEVDLHVQQKDAVQDLGPHSLISAGNLLLEVLGQTFVCCLKGAELMINEFNAKMAQSGGMGAAPAEPPQSPPPSPPPSPVEEEELPYVESVFPPPREQQVMAEAEAQPILEEASEDLVLEARRAKENFMESFKAHLNVRCTPEEEAQNEAEVAKQHFLEAFASKATAQELPLRKRVADEELHSSELAQLLLAQHRSKVEKELQHQRQQHEAAMDHILLQVQELQRELRESLDARQATEMEKVELMESHRRELEEMRRSNPDGGQDMESLQKRSADLEVENAECKVKLSEAATALWSHEAALQEALQEASTLRSELLNTTAAEEEIALLREELAKLRNEGAVASNAEAEQQMRALAEDYQRALADISSLRAIYDSEIEGLQEELLQSKAAQQEEVASLQEQLQSAKEQVESAKKSQSLQDVLSKRVVQLEAKLTQQGMEKEALAEELEKLRPVAASTAEVEQRASEAEEVLATTAANFQAAEARQLQAEEMVRQLKQRCQSLEAQLQSKRSEHPTSFRSDPALGTKVSKPLTRPEHPIKSMGSMPPSKIPVARVEGPMVGISSALSPTAPNTPLLETRKVLVQRPNE